MKILIYIACLCILGAPCFAQISTTPLLEADSTEQIIAYSKKQKGLVDSQWALFSNNEMPIFIISNDPFSGRATTFVHGYFKKDSKWMLFFNYTALKDAWVSMYLSRATQDLVLLGQQDQKIFSISIHDLHPLKIQ